MSYITRTYRIFNPTDASVLLETTSPDDAWLAFTDLDASHPAILQVLAESGWVTISLASLGCLAVW